MDERQQIARPPGTGKTHPAVALAKTLLDEGYDIHFSSARPLLWEIRETWGSPGDLGKSRGTCLLLFDMLNGRYEDALPDYLDFRLLDRLRENGGVVVPFMWPSARGLWVVA